MSKLLIKQCISTKQSSGLYESIRLNLMLNLGKLLTLSRSLVPNGGFLLIMASILGALVSRSESIVVMLARTRWLEITSPMLEICLKI